MRKEDKGMSEKKAFRCLVLCLAGGLVAAAVMVFCIDPFYHYHDAWFGLPVVLENAVYQTSGAARNFDYDSVIIGTSMTENFHAKWFDEEMGWDTVKLSYSGARTDDLKAILEQIYSKKESPKHIVMDVNAYQLTVDPDSAYAVRPAYLYDQQFITDVSYLYNQDVYLASMNRVLDKLTGRESNLDDAYTWEEEEHFGKDKTLLAEQKTRVSLEESIKAGMQQASLDICDHNLDNILPFIEAHPETDFYIFYPPYSMLYWEQEIMKGNLEQMITVYGRSIERLLQYDNVKIFYFQNEKEIISNLDNYRDSTHFRPEYNRYICQCMKSGENLVTGENYQEQLQDMYEYANSFDYEALWTGVSVAGT